MTLKQSQKSLRSWTKQKWGTKSGKKSSETGERYLPKAARDALTPAEYAATSRKKREDTKKGKQHSKQPKKIARKTRQFRKIRYAGGLATQADFLNKFTPSSKTVFDRTDNQMDSLITKDVGKIEPLTPFEAEQLNKKQLSTDPVIKNLQKVTRGLHTFLVPDMSNPLDIFLSGLGPPGKAVKGSVKLLNKNDTIISDEKAQSLFNVKDEFFVINNQKKELDRLNKQFNIQEDKVPNWKAIELQKNITDSERILKEYSNRAIKKINKKIKKIIDDRIIPELNPSKIRKLEGSFGNMPKTILDAAGSTKNKNIIKKLGHNLGSGTLSGLDEHLASNFFLRNIDDIIRYNSPVPKKDIKILSSGKVGDKNPLNILETFADKQTHESFILGYDSHRISSFAQGRQPFYVSPKKLADKLTQSSKGDDFFKLRIKEKDYLKELEESIKRSKYKPQAVRIDVYPTGNAAVFEGNHRLYRALKKGDEEIPVTFHYIEGAERINGPFSIKNLDSFLAPGKKGYKTNEEYFDYVNKVNESYGLYRKVKNIGKFKKVKDAFGTVHKGKIKGFNVEIYKDPGLTSGQQYAMVIKDPKVIMDKSKSIGLYSKNLDEAKESAVDEISQLVKKGSLTDITKWAAKNPEDKITASLSGEFMQKAMQKYPEIKNLEKLVIKAVEDKIL